MEEVLFTIFKYARTASSYTSYITSKLLSTSNPLRQYATSNPDLTNIVLLLIIIYLSLSILNMTVRWVYSLIAGIARLGFWIAVVGVGIWVWQSGPQEVVQVISELGRRLKEEASKGSEEGYGYAVKQDWNAQQGGGLY